MDTFLTFLIVIGLMMIGVGMIGIDVIVLWLHSFAPLNVIGSLPPAL